MRSLSDSALLLSLVAMEEPTTKQALFFVGLTLPAFALLAVFTAKEARARLRTPALLLGAWALFMVVARTRWFSLGTRDVSALLSSVAGALGGARIAWMLVVDVFLKEGSRIGLSKLARDLLHAVLMIFVAISAARAAGADAQALATTGGLVTAGLTFSLQQTLGDLVAGILLSARALRGRRLDRLRRPEQAHRSRDRDQLARHALADQRRGRGGGSELDAVEGGD